MPDVGVKFTADAREIDRVMDGLAQKMDALRAKANIPFTGLTGGANPTSATGAAGAVTGVPAAQVPNPSNSSLAWLQAQTAQAQAVRAQMGNPTSPPLTGNSMPSAPSPVSSSYSNPPASSAAGAIPSGAPPAGPPPSPPSTPASAPGWPGGQMPPWANPAPPSPPSPPSPANPTGPQWNNWQRQMAMRAAGNMAGRTIGGGIGLWAHQTASGDYDPMASAELYGQALGGVVGGLTGMALTPTAPGAGFATGAMMGMMGGGAAAQAVMAPFMRTRTSAQTLASIAAREGVSTYDLILPPDRTLSVGKDGIRSTSSGIGGAGGFQDIANRISMEGKSAKDLALLRMGLYTGTDITSVPQFSETYATLGSGYLEAGKTGTINSTERLARKYGINAPAMARRAASVLAQTSRQDDNETDLLLAAGPEDYGAYQDAMGGKDLTAAQRTAYGTVQRMQHRIEKASLQARGSGKAQVQLLEQERNAVAALPGGKESSVYAQIEADRRSAVLQQYHEEDVTAFDIPQAALRGQMERRRYLPYSPGSGLKLAIQDAALKSREYSVKSRRYHDLMGRGQLSEDEQLRGFEELEGLKTGIAADVATVNTNIEDRLLGMSAGRPSFRGHWDSMSLTRFALFQANSPNQSAGAVSGRQLQMQRNWQAAFASPDLDVERAFAPHSRTQGMNNARDTNLLQQIASALQQLVQNTRPGTTLRNPGAGLHPGEFYGNFGGVTRTYQLDPRQNYRR